MIKLSGILEYSMGGFLCLRGFASYKMLSAISKPNTEVQRGLIDEHKGDMARFLNAGEYKFFPEVILAINLTDGDKHFDEVEFVSYVVAIGPNWEQKHRKFSIQYLTPCKQKHIEFNMTAYQELKEFIWLI